MKKKALIVGINYVGTGTELRGCINDARNMQAMLAARGFEIEMCLEKDATTQGIKDGLARLTSNASVGDTLVFHYSGHGSQWPSKNEPDGFEEIICPIDLNWRDKVITDDTLRAIFNQVPNGVNVTVVLDCCHSGTGLDQTATYVKKKPRAKAEKALAAEMETRGSRYLPPPANIAEMLEGTELVQWSTSRDVNASALLIAGCRADQTSADAFIDGSFQGAASAAMLSALKANPKITYAQLIEEMNDYMQVRRFEQEPQLDGFPGLYNLEFLSSFVADGLVDSVLGNTVVEIPDTVPSYSVPEKDNSVVFLALGIIGLLIMFAL